MDKIVNLLITSEDSLHVPEMFVVLVVSLSSVLDGLGYYVSAM